MAKKKWAQDVDLDEGSLTALGWPNVGSLLQAVRDGKVSYAKLQQKLTYLANVSKDSKTKTKARAAIVRVRRTFGKEKK